MSGSMSYKVKAEEKKEKDKGMMEKAGEKLGEIKETMREAVDVVAGKTQEGMQSAKEAFNRGVEGLQEGASNITGRLENQALLTESAFLTTSLLNHPNNDIYERFARSQTIPKTQTNASGIPTNSQTATFRVGQFGPALLADVHLLEALRHNDTERIPERLVHATGAGAHGYFEVTNPEIKRYCRAKIFESVGKRTPMFARCSVVSPERGGSDLVRDLRGFALKFYTEEGNWDLVCNNSPIFFIRDPILFPAFTRVLKPNAVTGMKHGHRPDPAQFWDFMSLRPESTHQVCWVYGDRGIPDGYRHMDGFGANTFKMVNDEGVAHFVKFHFVSRQGKDFVSDGEGIRRGGLDPDYSKRDLWLAIDRGEYPSWTMCIQVMPVEDAHKYDFTFDVTKVWPHAMFPLIEVGVMTLDRNPSNYFEEVEQSSFKPSEMIPGIEPSADVLLQGRLFAYADTAVHRLGRNNRNIPINKPKVDVHNYSRFGYFAMGMENPEPSYYPNGYNGPIPRERPWHQDRVEGWTNRDELVSGDDYSQARKLVMEVFDDAARERFIANVAGNLVYAPPVVRERTLRNMFDPVDKGVGDRIREQMKKLSSMSSLPPPA